MLLEKPPQAILYLKYADIILPIAFDSFTYLVPPNMEGRVVRGCRVVVPLGKNKIYTGVVLRVHDQQPQGVEMKSIIELLDEMPVINEQQFALWLWIAHYYICPLGDVMKCALPGAMKPQDEQALKEKDRKRRGAVPTDIDPYSLRSLNPLSPYQQKALDEIDAGFSQ